MKQPAHRRHDLTDHFPDTAYRCTLAGPAARLRRLEQHPPPFHSLAQKGIRTKLMFILAGEKGME